MRAAPSARLGGDFYARSVHDVARDLIGCVVRHGETAGRIVETESYHMEEPACHAYAGVTERTSTLFGPPGNAYVYFSYGVHSLLNAVTEEEGVGAAVLIRALEPVDGIEVMRERRRVTSDEELCSGPGKLTQALGIGLSLNGTSLVDGPIEVLTREPGSREPRVVIGRADRHHQGSRAALALLRRRLSSRVATLAGRDARGAASA